MILPEIAPWDMVVVVIVVDVVDVVSWHWHSTQLSMSGLGPQQSPPSQLHISVLATSSQRPSPM